MSYLSDKLKNSLAIKNGKNKEKFIENEKFNKLKAPISTLIDDFLEMSDEFACSFEGSAVTNAEFYTSIHSVRFPNGNGLVYEVSMVEEAFDSVLLSYAADMAANDWHVEIIASNLVENLRLNIENNFSASISVEFIVNYKHYCSCRNAPLRCYDSISVQDAYIESQRLKHNIYS